MNSRRGPKRHPARRARLGAAAMSAVAFFGLGAVIAGREASRPAADTTTSWAVVPDPPEGEVTGPALPGWLDPIAAPDTSSHAS